MKILAEGTFDDRSQTFLVRVEHDQRRYTLAIARDVFIRQFGAAPTGRFHEYWSLVLDNQAVLETIANFKLGARDKEDSGVIFITHADFPV